MTTQLEYFEHINGEQTDDGLGSSCKAKNIPLGSNPTLGGKPVAYPMSIDDAIEFASDPRHESGMMFDERPLTNLEMMAILVASKHDLLIQARKWCESLKRFLDTEELLTCQLQ